MNDLLVNKEQLNVAAEVLYKFWSTETVTNDFLPLIAPGQINQIGQRVRDFLYEMYKHHLSLISPWAGSSKALDTEVVTTVGYSYSEMGVGNVLVWRDIQISWLGNPNKLAFISRLPTEEEFDQFKKELSTIVHVTESK